MRLPLDFFDLKLREIRLLVTLVAQEGKQPLTRSGLGDSRLTSQLSTLISGGYVTADESSTPHRLEPQPELFVVAADVLVLAAKMGPGPVLPQQRKPEDGFRISMPTQRTQAHEYELLDAPGALVTALSVYRQGWAASSVAPETVRQSFAALAGTPQDQRCDNAIATLRSMALVEEDSPGYRPMASRHRRVGEFRLSVSGGDFLNRAEQMLSELRRLGHESPTVRRLVRERVEVARATALGSASPDLGLGGFRNP